MHAEKKTSTITTKTAGAGTGGKGETINEERAALVRSTQLPSYLQRRGVSAEEEEKKKDIMRKHALANKNVSVRTNH